MAVGGQTRQVVGQLGDDVHVVDAQRVRQNLQRVPDDLVQVHGRALGRVLPGQGQEVLHDAAAALGRPSDLLGAADAAGSVARASIAV
jgi:hypothetical protein